MSSSECLNHEAENSCFLKSANQECIFFYDENRRSPLSLSQGGGYFIPQTEQFCQENDDRCLSSPPELTSDTKFHLHHDGDLSSIENCGNTRKDVWDFENRKTVDSETDLDQATTVSSYDDHECSAKLRTSSLEFEAASATKIETDPAKICNHIRKKVQELYGQPSWWGQDNDDEISYPSTSYCRARLASVQPDSSALMDKSPIGDNCDEPKSEQCTPRPAAQAFVIDFSADTAGEHRPSSTTGSLSQYVPTRLRQGFLEREKQKKEREMQAEIRRKNAVSMVETQISKKMTASKAAIRRVQTCHETKTPQQTSLSGKALPRQTSTTAKSQRTSQAGDGTANRCTSARPTSLAYTNQTELMRQRPGSGKLRSAPSGRPLTVTSTPPSPFSRTQNPREVASLRTQNLNRSNPSTGRVNRVNAASSEVVTEPGKAIAKASAGIPTVSPLARETKLTLARRNAASLRQATGSGAQKAASKRSSIIVSSSCLHDPTSTVGDRSVSRVPVGKDGLQRHRLSLPRNFMSPTTSSGAKNVHLQNVAPVKVRSQSNTTPADSAAKKTAPRSKGLCKGPADPTGTAAFIQRSRKGRLQDASTKSDSYVPKRNSVHGDQIYPNELTASLIAEIEAFEDPKEYLFHRMFQGSSGIPVGENDTTSMDENSQVESTFPIESSPEDEEKPLHFHPQTSHEGVTSSPNTQDSNVSPVQDKPGMSVRFRHEEETKSPDSTTAKHLGLTPSVEPGLPAGNRAGSFRNIGPVVSSKSPVFQRRIIGDTIVQTPAGAKQMDSCAAIEKPGDLLGTSMLVCTSVASLAATYILDAEETLLGQQERLRKLLESGQSVVAKPNSTRTSTDKNITGVSQAVSSHEAGDPDNATPRGSPDKEFEEFERLVEEKGIDFWEPTLPIDSTNSRTTAPNTLTVESHDSTALREQPVSDLKCDNEVLRKTEATQPANNNRFYLNKGRSTLNSNPLPTLADTRSQDDMNLDSAAASSKQNDVLLPGLSLTSLAKTYVIDRETVAPSDGTGLHPILPEGHDLNEEDIVSASIEWVTSRPDAKPVTSDFKELTEVVTPTGSPQGGQSEVSHQPQLDAAGQGKGIRHGQLLKSDDDAVDSGELEGKEIKRGSSVDESSRYAWQRGQKQTASVAVPPGRTEKRLQEVPHNVLNFLPYSVQVTEQDVQPRQYIPDTHVDTLTEASNTHFEPSNYPPAGQNGPTKWQLKHSHVDTSLHHHYLALQNSVRQQLLMAHEQQGTWGYQQTPGLAFPHHSWAPAAGPYIEQGQSFQVPGSAAPSAPKSAGTRASTVSSSTLERPTVTRLLSAWNRNDRRNRSTTSLDSALKLLEHSSARMENRNVLRRSAERDNTSFLRYSCQQIASELRGAGGDVKVKEGCTGANDLTHLCDDLARSTAKQVSHPPVRSYSQRVGLSSTAGVLDAHYNRGISPLPVSPRDDRINPSKAAPPSLRSSGDGVSDRVTTTSSIDGAAMVNSPCEHVQCGSSSTAWIHQNQSGKDRPAIPDYCHFDSRTYTRRSSKQGNTKTLSDMQMIDANISDQVELLRLGGEARHISLTGSPPSSTIQGYTSACLRKFSQPTPADLPDSTSGPKPMELHRSAFRTPMPQHYYLPNQAMTHTESNRMSGPANIQPIGGSCKASTSHMDDSEATIPYTCIVDSIHQLSVKLRHCSDNLVKRVNSEHSDNTSRGTITNNECWTSASSPLEKVPTETKLALTSALTNMQTIKDQLTAVEQLLSTSESTSLRLVGNADETEDLHQQLFSFVPIDLHSDNNGKTTDLQLQRYAAANSLPHQLPPRQSRQRPASAIITDSVTSELVVPRFHPPNSNCLATQPTQTHQQWTDQKFEDEFY